MDALPSHPLDVPVNKLAEPGSKPRPFPKGASLEEKDPAYALQHAFSAIGEHEANVRAWTHIASRKDLPKPEVLNGPLAGVPFGVKDVIMAAGMPTRCGSPASDDRAAAFNGASVDLLARAGAIPLVCCLINGDSYERCFV